jgi:hypothetical protein
MVFCEACGFTTDATRIKGVALKLWNEAKPPAKRRARNKRG